MQEKWVTTRCIEIHEEKYFISWEQNQFRIQIPGACVKFFPLGAIVVIKNICKRINIHHQAARKYVKYN